MAMKKEKLKISFVQFKGTNKKYAGMTVERIHLTKIKISEIRKLGDKYSKSLFSNGVTGFINVTMVVKSSK